ncbi:hypothetical protein M885DRAFT_512469 [Pelagophyceae sp. CCMP2097]|nr:hypothetical protein M885DRAFT_512469 [Pelagophyceae sp. CCMP2097]
MGDAACLVPQLRLIKDPRLQPAAVAPPNWKPQSRVGGKYEVLGKNGATVRAGVSLESESVGMLDVREIVQIVQVSTCGTRCRIEDPYAGWISTRMLAPHSVQQAKAAWKHDAAEVDEGWETHGYGLDMEDFADPQNYTLENIRKGLAR